MFFPYLRKNRLHLLRYPVLYLPLLRIEVHPHQHDFLARVQIAAVIVAFLDLLQSGFLAFVELELKHEHEVLVRGNGVNAPAVCL